ncbi:uncharacterized protein LOC130715414 isoform X2 [Lotus japonicus]|uniref:uncharacterized protein LOC130715414 isoform X2 n=1 Tax=Lotus japonicus TaxID=34305 RepID=UPI00258A3537|nr:uncharacterized protein LOC130715414 isoform X2 [Lotus japonicus]
MGLKVRNMKFMVYQICGCKRGKSRRKLSSSLPIRGRSQQTWRRTLICTRAMQISICWQERPVYPEIRCCGTVCLGFNSNLGEFMFDDTAERFNADLLSDWEYAPSWTLQRSLQIQLRSR